MSSTKNIEKKGAKKADGGADKGTRNFTRADFSLLCDWLEVGANREKLQGCEKKTKVGARPVVRAKALEDLADFINANQKKGSKLSTVNGKSMKTRWKYYLKRYNQTMALTKETGFGLTDKDLAEGIETIEAKLDKLCPFFTRMHNMFSKQPNVDDSLDYISTLAGQDAQGGDDVNVEEGSPDTDHSPNHLTHLDGGGDQFDREDETLNCEIADSPFLNVDGEEMEADGFIPDSIPMGAIPDSIPPTSPGHTILEPATGGPFEQGANGGSAERGRDELGAAPTPPVREDGHQRASTEDCRPEPPQTATKRTSAANGVGRGNGANNVGRAWGTSKSTATSRGTDKPYPGKKQINENRHSINGAFAANLENVNSQKERANDLRAERNDRKRSFEQTKFAWQKEVHAVERLEQRNLEEQKLQWERDRHKAEQEHKDKELDAMKAQRIADRKAQRNERKANHELQTRLALISCTKTPAELKGLLDLFNFDK